LEAYKRMPDSVLFRVQQVEVEISEFDMPGPTRRKATCTRCGQVVRDHREVIREEEILCRPCAEGAYFKHAKEINWPDMNWTPKKESSQHSAVSEQKETNNQSSIKLKE